MHSMDDSVLCEPEHYDIDFESSVTEMDDNCNDVVPESEVQVIVQEMTILRNPVSDPLEDDGNCGIDLYIKVCEGLKRMRDVPL